jgi:hypothetical protein
VSSLTTFNRKVVLFLATKPLTCTHINSIGLSSQCRTGVLILEWFENQLMPALKNPSLVVLDNASYHNVKIEDTVCPKFSQKKVVLQKYLTQHSSPGDSHHPLIWPETLNLSRQSNPHFAYLHAKQSNVCLCPRVFLGHQTHHSEATYNLCSNLL